MKTESQILILAKKLYQLSRRGVGGEKDNAVKKLQAFMLKHNISFDEIEDPERKAETFHSSKKHRKILVQIIYMVLGKVDMFGRKDKPSQIIVDCSKSEFIEITVNFDFYTEKYNEELDLFTSAFIQKNELFRKGVYADSDEENDAEIDKMARMMSGMKQHKMQKRIED